ncbi:MAG: M20/M25/M40 family metallo-hydrolase [Candidatus Calescibacterium sp.]|nr:M20/M25/M40 family metallo-hydrolase [Candidatus Calescibacterium sp.]MCX7734105.1 M20/M25/M40 family metallo-hydrolase [bacterium]
MEDIKSIINSVRWNEIRDEAVEILRALIRIDTTNPPGNERPAAEYLKKYFSDYEIDSYIVESEQSRASIIADLENGRKEKPLILLSHLDVVPADPKQWSVHPFSAEVKNGYIWGRGTIDCKGLAVVEAVAMTLVKRLKIPLRRPVKFISVADEEMGGEKGAGYIVREENIDGYCVINEGGTGAILGDKKVYLPCFGEKGPIWLKIKAKGRSGHASMPIEDNPNLILLRALYKITSSGLGKKFVENFVRSVKFYLAKDIKPLEPVLSIVEKSEFLKTTIGNILYNILKRKPKLAAMLSNTVSVTMIKSGYKENVIPEEAEAILDIRILPGYDYYEVVEKLKKIVNDQRVSFEIISAYEPSESDPSSDVLKKIKDSVKLVYDYPFVPIISTGFTDSRFFRKKGIQSFGLLPFFLTEEEISTMHGVDERISIENMEIGTKLMLSTILNLCL